MHYVLISCFFSRYNTLTVHFTQPKQIQVSNHTINFQSLSVTVIKQMMSESFSYLDATNVDIYAYYPVSLLNPPRTLTTPTPQYM